ncbi:hypothetical protein [Paractinoplanes lichenicola]|uniref:hypothetical protein n=1 Tax=Paractinoplanes lichenicola TaxID=2802976 RepID=UPI001F40439F|nr:hypothetical protein [Actinoplanes lichenicola]
MIRGRTTPVSGWRGPARLGCAARRGGVRREPVAAGVVSFAPGSSGWGRPFYELLLRGGNAADALGRPRAGAPVVITPP